ncbi:MAG TPA: DUF4038 domain-containing protein [Candidatus Lokiarchaeia archaeon]|nr:DUF4038 domain-containing protein [Candidatus Lokiarchaeia archaeon]
MAEIPKNNILELSFESRNESQRDDVELFLSATSPDGQVKRIPGFWAGSSTWRMRFSSDMLGKHEYTTTCSDTTDDGLHGQTGTIDVIPYAGDNPLYTHGQLRVATGKKHLEHADSTPFFWLGDTWWMGFTKRLQWPEEFQSLVEDRVQKGFTLVQIVAGLYPDMPPFDERGANEAGFPWQDGKFEYINPAYFDLVDLRVQHLVESGLVPCIVGSWGYFIGVAGVAALKMHWRNLIARYGAYPVVWCVAGEAMMQYYLNQVDKKTWRKQERPRRLSAWSELATYIREIDAFHNPITVHPTRFGHEQLDKPKLLDVNMLQTGHANPASEISTIKNTVKMVQTARKQGMPVVVGEVCYEGIMEGNRQEIQRCLFWATMLSGGAGHTYGANGIWQVNRRDKPFGPSPYGVSWGNTPWEDAYQLPGSRHVGVCKNILAKYPWWTLESHPEWVKNPLMFAAGIPGQLRVIYRFLPGRFKIWKLENAVKYTATLIDPKDGTSNVVGTVQPDKRGVWTCSPKINQDWVLALERT